jgi:methylmalonyl-CoA/ethylmalonyl-CoA epimerase
MTQAPESSNQTESTVAPTRINHLGIAVRTLEEGLAIWRDALGLPLQQVLELPERGLKVAFLQCGETMIELLAPLHDDSEVSKFLATRGAGVHHVCLETADIGGASAHAEQAGLKMLGAAPSLGAEGYPVRFAHPKTTGGVLVELLHKPVE